MRDFKNQADIFIWLSEDESRRIRHREDNSVVGVKGGYLYFFSPNGHHIPCDYNLRWNIDRWKKVKPKVKYLKPLHQILNENPGYVADGDGDIWHNNWIFPLTRDDFQYLDAPHDTSEVALFDDCWVEEREVEQ